MISFVCCECCAVCDTNCTSDCVSNSSGDGKCDSECRTGYSLKHDDHTCIRKYHLSAQCLMKQSIDVKTLKKTKTLKSHKREETNPFKNVTKVTFNLSLDAHRLGPSGSSLLVLNESPVAT